jgi:hypothetical protein
LHAILAVGGLSAVTAVQHLLGLAMAAAIYAILLRRGTPRWLAAIAAAPVLLDAYQIQIEQTIMPDVWFEAVLVGAIALLLAAGTDDQVRARQRDDGQGEDGQADPADDHRRRVRRGLVAVAAAGLLLGASAPIRQVGEILILPGLLYVVAIGGGLRAAASRAVTLTIAFAVPVVGYMAGSDVISGHFWLASATPSVSTYGRMATAADCPALKIPRYERALCPTARQRAYGIDWLDHDASSPLKTYVAPPGMSRYAVIAGFDRQVAEQQPLRVAAAIAPHGL